MDDILRRLYSGEFFPQENTRSKNEKLKKKMKSWKTVIRKLWWHSQKNMEMK